MRKLNQKGSVLVFFTLAFALLGTFIGFAVDFGRAYLQKARISRLVDGAALAAAKALKGQVGIEDEATKAACDSMEMNGAPVVMSGPRLCGDYWGAFHGYIPIPSLSRSPEVRRCSTCRSPESSQCPRPFSNFLVGWFPVTYSTIDVAAIAASSAGAADRLVLVLDRSGSMSGTKIAALKTTVNEFLDNNFTGNDRIGMVSFAWRGCGNAAGLDNFAANIARPMCRWTYATSGFINTLKTKVNALTTNNGATDTMEALRTARVPIAAAFNDPTRVATRKVVLLITDGKPTAMRRDTDAQCKQNPKDQRAGGCMGYDRPTLSKRLFNGRK